MSKDMEPGSFDSKVAAERQKYAAEKPYNLVNPDSPIQQQLAGK